MEKRQDAPPFNFHPTLMQLVGCLRGWRPMVSWCCFSSKVSAIKVRDKDAKGSESALIFRNNRVRLKWCRSRL